MDLSLAGMSRAIDTLKWRFNHSSYYVHLESALYEGSERQPRFYYDTKKDPKSLSIREDIRDLADHIAPGHWRAFPHSYRSFRIYFALEKECEDFKLALKLMLGTNEGWR